MRMFNRSTCVNLAFACMLAVTFSISVREAYAVTPVKMAAKHQTKSAEPLPRSIHLKLPLQQPNYHWTFNSRKDCLAGKLSLQIIRGDERNTVVIFEDGQLTDGWTPFVFSNPKGGEIYFGFQSTKKYPTAPGDKLQLEFVVKKDLDGIGSMQTGVLPKGTYVTTGDYSGLIDEYNVPVPSSDLPDVVFERIRKHFEHKAFLENWDEQWSLNITGEVGWLSPAQRARYEALTKISQAEENNN